LIPPRASYIPTTLHRITGGVKAYCRKVNYYYLDRDNSASPFRAAPSEPEHFHDLPAPITRPSAALGHDPLYDGRDTRSVTSPPTSCLMTSLRALKRVRFVFLLHQHGYATDLSNGYTIFESIESVNNLAIMNGRKPSRSPRDAGGVPVNAPLIPIDRR
jgi:hypothetical protein